MKKLLVYVILPVMVMLGCGGSSSNSGDLNFYAETEAVTPTVVPTAVTSVSGTVKSASWSSGNNLYEIYNLIREYVNSRDNGVVDGSNMHKAMYEAESYVNAAINGCTGTTNEDGSITPSNNLITTQSVTSPFDFGSDLMAQTYDCAFDTQESGTIGGEAIEYTKSFAVRQSGTAYYMLMGWYATTASQNSPSAMQVQYDTAANTIAVNNAYLVNYTSGEKYAVRLHVDGNIGTHLFNLRLFKYGSGGTNISIAGRGYAEGEGKYYLFRLTTTGTNEDVVDKYFCFASATTDVEMQAMDDVGSATVPTECADLSADLPANYNIDASEVPTTDAAFTGGGTSGIELSWTE